MCNRHTEKPAIHGVLIQNKWATCKLYCAFMWNWFNKEIWPIRLRLYTDCTLLLGKLFNSTRFPRLLLKRFRFMQEIIIFSIFKQVKALLPTAKGLSGEVKMKQICFNSLLSQRKSNNGIRKFTKYSNVLALFNFSRHFTPVVKHSGYMSYPKHWRPKTDSQFYWSYIPF